MLATVLSALFGLILFGVDQWVKHIVSAAIPLGESRPLVPGFVELRTVHNYGAAWSSFSGQRWFLTAATSVIVLLILAALFKKIVRHPLGVLSGCLIISGGVGNIVDRVRLGYVVDMFNFQFMNYPVFNVADMCVVTGCILGLIYYQWFYEKYDKRGKNDGDADALSGGT